MMNARIPNASLPPARCNIDEPVHHFDVQENTTKYILGN